MLADSLSGRPLELDAKIGAIVKLGKDHNIPILFSIQTHKLLLALSNDF